MALLASANSETIEKVLEQLGPSFAFSRVCPQPVDHTAIHFDRVGSSGNGRNTCPNIWELGETKRGNGNRNFFVSLKNLKGFVRHVVTDDSDPDA